MPFAQLVVGSPGSGKSTYCDGSEFPTLPGLRSRYLWKCNLDSLYDCRLTFPFLCLVHQFLGAIGRACSVVNLDPANDHTNYPSALDIRSLVKLEDIMRQDQLGPNGGILYALEELEHNFDWLEEGLKEFGEDYILFDCPGQVELYTHHNSLRNIFYKLQKLGFRVRVSKFLGLAIIYLYLLLTSFSLSVFISRIPSALLNRPCTSPTSSSRFEP